MQAGGISGLLVKIISKFKIYSDFYWFFKSFYIALQWKYFASFTAVATEGINHTSNATKSPPTFKISAALSKNARIPTTF